MKMQKNNLFHNLNKIPGSASEGSAQKCPGFSFPQVSRKSVQLILCYLAYNHIYKTQASRGETITSFVEVIRVKF